MGYITRITRTLIQIGIRVKDPSCKGLCGLVLCVWIFLAAEVQEEKVQEEEVQEEKVQEEVREEKVQEEEVQEEVQEEEVQEEVWEDEVLEHELLAAIESVIVKERQG